YRLTKQVSPLKVHKMEAREGLRPVHFRADCVMLGRKDLKAIYAVRCHSRGEKASNLLARVIRIIRISFDSAPRRSIKVVEGSTKATGTCEHLAKEIASRLRGCAYYIPPHGFRM